MARGQTCDVHSAQIRGSLGLRLYAASDAEPLQVFLVQRAMHRDDAGILIAEAAIGLWSFVPGPRVQGV